jgi:hypothetical protein
VKQSNYNYIYCYNHKLIQKALEDKTPLQYADFKKYRYWITLRINNISIFKFYWHTNGTIKPVHTNPLPNNFEYRMDLKEEKKLECFDFKLTLQFSFRFKT